MATHSNTLAWRIPWTEEPVRLQSMGLLRVIHDWSDLALAAAAACRNQMGWLLWRRKRPGENCLPILYIALFTCQSQLPIYPPPSFPQVIISSLSLWVSLYCKKCSFVLFCLDSTYKWYHMVFVFLCVTYFTQYGNL